MGSTSSAARKFLPADRIDPSIFSSGAVLSRNVQRGPSLAVFGAGAVGLAAVLAGVVAGAATIVAVDVHHERRELAIELGATHVVDATGVPHVAESAVAATRVGGACAGHLPIERLIEQFPLSAIDDVEQASLSGRLVKPVQIP